MSTTVTTNAIAGVNKDKQNAIVDLAQAKITYILRERAQIKGYRDCIKVQQEALSKLAEDVLTADMVFGRPASLSPSISEATILTAIAKRNEEKQKCIEAGGKTHVAAIDGYNASIKGCNDRIEALRKELNALATDVVTEAQVLG